MKNFFISFVVIIPITFSLNLGAQEPASKIHVILKQFIKGSYNGKETMLPIIMKGFRSSDIKVRLGAIEAFDVGIRRRELAITLEELNKPEFKDLFAGLLNDEYAFMRSSGVRYLLTLSTPDSKSIGLSIRALEKETDEESLEKMIRDFGLPHSFLKNKKDKSLITLMLNAQARKRQGRKLSRPALLAARMLSRMERQPEDILELVVNDLYGRSIPSRSFDIFRNYGKASKKHLKVLYEIQKDLNNEKYKYDRPQDKDYRDIKYIDQLVGHIESL